MIVVRFKEGSYDSAREIATSLASTFKDWNTEIPGGTYRLIEGKGISIIPNIVGSDSYGSVLSQILVESALEKETITTLAEARKYALSRLQEISESLNLNPTNADLYMILAAIRKC